MSHPKAEVTCCVYSGISVSVASKPTASLDAPFFLWLSIVPSLRAQLPTYGNHTPAPNPSFLMSSTSPWCDEGAFSRNCTRGIEFCCHPGVVLHSGIFSGTFLPNCQDQPYHGYVRALKGEVGGDCSGQCFTISGDTVSLVLMDNQLLPLVQ